MGTIIFRLRVTLYTITLLSVSLLAVFIGLFCTIIGKRLNTNYYVARTFWLTAGPIMGWKFIVEGEEYLWNLKEGEGGSGGEGVAGKTGRSAVMVGNHQRSAWRLLSVNARLILIIHQLRRYPLPRAYIPQTCCDHGQEVHPVDTRPRVVYALVWDRLHQQR